MPTDDELVTDILNREVHPSERGLPWADIVARLHPADRGGWTRAGITARSWGEYAGYGRDATGAELNRITEAEARQFYWSRYVRPFQGVADPQLRALLVDWAVTSGQIIPVRALQRSLRDAGVSPGPVDGILGSQTLGALAVAPDPKRLYQEVLAARMAFYVDLGLNGHDVQAFLTTHPRSQLHFVRGWLNRCYAFLVTS